MRIHYSVAALCLLAAPIALVYAPFPGASLGTPPAPVATESGSEKIIYLKSGHMLSGDVLKQKADATVLDLGFTLLEIPADEIDHCVAREASQPEETAGADVSPQGAIFTEGAVAGTVDRPVKDLAQDLCESVALISTPGGLGSGFAIDAQGHFVTNAHVVQGEQEISVTLFKRGDSSLERVKIDKVRIEAVNPFLDLALLRVNAPAGMQFKAVPLASTASLQDGQPVFAIGNPLGLERTVSEGIVSNARRDFEGQLFLQTTAPINPGNSGGPLFNLRGEVIGVTNMKAGLLTEGLSFAIPITTVKFFLSNREAFAFDKDNPNSGFHYLPPPHKVATAGGASQVAVHP